ncbi:S1C family serine protease [Desulfobacula sp.]|uniref:S1C family serine protease n=1 Tax=Desulfobacula sp. TaxID=2593537 RepID=UPI0026328A18|nr:S1C family serine protease [Desulfobacula sp.]
MQHLKSFLLTIFLIFFSYVPVLAIDAPTIFRNSKDSVVLLMSFDENGQPLSIGSGFFIHTGENLVSNFHVLNGASSVKAKTTSGKVIEIKEIFGIDEKHDLVILSTPFKGVPLLLADRVSDQTWEG